MGFVATLILPSSRDKVACWVPIKIKINWHEKKKFWLSIIAILIRRLYVSLLLKSKIAGENKRLIRKWVI